MNRALNILIIRTSAIGDIVFASALIGVLRRSYPDSRISWLAEPGNATLLQQHPELDEVLVWPKSEWKQLWRERRYGYLWRTLLSFREELSGREFDLVLDLQGLLKSGVLAWFTGAPERIGLGSREGSRRLMTRVIDRAGDPDRIGSEYLHLAETMGLDTKPFEMQLALGEGDLTFVDDLISDKRLERGYLAICPFTTRAQKHWFESRWELLLAEFEEKVQLPVLILGGPGDQSQAESLAERAKGQVINLAGKTSLTQAAAVVSRASLLVGVDTGLTHMGIAFAIPTIALFGATCPYRNTTRKNARVIYHKFNCSPCRRSPTCGGEFYCMQSIGVREVMDESISLLEQREHAVADSAGNA